MPLRILTDDFEELPTENFVKYSKLIMGMINNSFPNFSVGIYGEWGMGKTTLMKFVYEHLKSNQYKNQSIIPVWFNAWMYERENQFALFPLLQTISKSIPSQDQDKKPLRVAFQKFTRGLSKGLLKSSPEIATSLLPSLVSEPFKKIAKNIASEVSDEFLSLFDQINEKIIEDTLYSTQIENIEKALEAYRQTNPSFRIVIFIDDLDRCYPKTTLEIFESIKVFLGLEGFIYILGISNATIIKLVNNQFKNLVDGERYLRKIIQVPITLPEWNDYIIMNELIKKIIDKLDDPYNKIINEKKGLIAKLTEFNPREVKRFINSFIIAREIFTEQIKSSEIKDDEILTIQALKMRWDDFFNIFSTNEDFRHLVKKYVST